MINCKVEHNKKLNISTTFSFVLSKFNSFQLLVRFEGFWCAPVLSYYTPLTFFLFLVELIPKSRSSTTSGGGHLSGLAPAAPAAAAATLCSSFPSKTNICSTVLSSVHLSKTILSQGSTPTPFIIACHPEESRTWR
jgi:hypothetical protein